MSEIKVNKLSPRSGTDITLGDSGDTITIPSGATLANSGIVTGFESTGIDDNATSTAITINSSEQVEFTAGTALLPSITTTGDVNTGIFFPAADTTAFTEGGTERMRIVSGGGVNVGSTVVSSASSDGNIVVGQGIYIGTYSGNNQVRSSSAGGGTTTLYIGNAAIQVSSDQRLKTNIINTTMSAIDKIKQVRIVDFNWNDPSDNSYNNRNARGVWTGVLAQELINVFPFAVNAPRKEEDLSVDMDSENTWQVDQAHLIPVLMKAIQEQQAIIEELKARITTLENK